MKKLHAGSKRSLFAAFAIGVSIVFVIPIAYDYLTQSNGDNAPLAAAEDPAVSIKHREQVAQETLHKQQLGKHASYVENLREQLIQVQARVIEIPEVVQVAYTAPAVVAPHVVPPVVSPAATVPIVSPVSQLMEHVETLKPVSAPPQPTPKPTPAPTTPPPPPPVIQATIPQAGSVENVQTIAYIQKQLSSEKGFVLFFLHLRRTGGSTLENQLLGNAIKDPKLVKQAGRRKVMLCKEGSDARWYYGNDPAVKSDVASRLSSVSMLTRHCPYGMHKLLAPGVSHLYATLLRDPVKRMYSWYKFCDKESPNKCGTGGNSLHKPPGSQARMAEFYQVRQAMAKAVGSNLPPVQKGAQFYPDSFEMIAGDDNHYVRLICGPAAHSKPFGTLDASDLKCAMTKLRDEFSLVGSADRMEEVGCAFRAFIGDPNAAATQKANKFQIQEITQASKDTIPAVFRSAIAEEIKYDEILYQYSRSLFEDMLTREIPQCRFKPTPSDVRPLNDAQYTQYL